MGTRRTEVKLKEECLKIAGVLDHLQSLRANQPNSANSSEPAERKLPSIVDMKRYCFWLELQSTLDSIFQEKDEE